MQKLSFKNLCIIGFTLFSMFFGAGNLIFPPLLGAQAGTATIPAMIGLILTAVCFPVLAVIAIAKHDGLSNLAGSIHPMFALVFTVLVYLLIGPCVAIPRTASTSFEMAVAPFISADGSALFMLRIAYSFVFFAAAMFTAMNPTRLKDLLGKIMTPILMVLIALVFLGALVKLPAVFSAPSGIYEKNALAAGFSTGYQTMDILAALNFGIIISINIGALGLTDKRSIAIETIKAGIIAGILLAVIYSATAYIGAVCSTNLPDATNGAVVLTYAVKSCYGFLGQIIVGLLFFIACFNVCVGLLSCCSEYFSQLVPKIGYKSWLLGFTLFSFVISSAGLDFILSFSLPILSVMCPIAVLITLYGLIRRGKL